MANIEGVAYVVPVSENRHALYMDAGAIVVIKDARPARIAPKKKRQKKGNGNAERLEGSNVYQLDGVCVSSNERANHGR
jgi:hypothetical protein